MVVIVMPMVCLLMNLLRFSLSFRHALTPDDGLSVCVLVCAPACSEVEGQDHLAVATFLCQRGTCVT